METGNSATSLLSYMHALQETYDDLQRSVGQLDYAEDFAFNIYHAPFGGLTRRAHRTLLRRAGVHDGEAALADFRRRSEPALRCNRRMGGTYAASTFVGLLGLAEHDEARAGDRLSIFSYGSGCCAELYRARFGRRFRALAERAALGGLVAARRQVTVAEYEALEAWRGGQEHAEELVRGASTLSDGLYEAEGSVVERLDEARRALERLTRFDPELRGMLEQLTEALHLVQDIGRRAGGDAASVRGRNIVSGEGGRGYVACRRDHRAKCFQSAA